MPTTRELTTSLLSPADAAVLEEIRRTYPPRSTPHSPPETTEATRRTIKATQRTASVSSAPWWKFPYRWTWPTRLLTVAGSSLAIQLGLIVAEVRSR